ncbi:MarR family transcriptional regulator [Streptomyces sp. Je 1-4]|uniref:MarR family winged helix-turn-helix transcriptional regulator n=1 Tax=Streptomyces TaxID=1883 RepID=UPI0021DA8C8D|nr:MULTISPECIES: MarR family transcriptional regulator [unclassified Streptomyces]UYB43929.1 MarR family transcriptional regulator [Streptomyces sp. Je 1-4]UZQ40351.1 MarR family transcriptional regulator [Streptomyces sp. Je 1-4] [Streptomyces sp. Je 1-4 4N24]UZQ47768.1 MarR family transcriptional regulator [Streptomyces sp. Je 1-4] [Streptomyces sp. Je 1-4 4N24_ara]
MMGGSEQELVDEWHGLLALHATVHNALEHELQAQHGLSVSEFEALELLVSSDHGKCRGQDLTQAVHLSQSAASRLVARLERGSLVERVMCDLDRRGIFVILTDEGHKRYRDAKPTHRSVLARTLRGDN